MTTRSPSQLELVRGLAETREQELAGELSELLRLRDGAEATLARLDGYLDEYAQVPGGGALVASAIANERRFVKRLNQALEQQRTHAERLRERTGEKTAQWQQARADLMALERVVERRLQEATQEVERREQREADALSLRRVVTEAAR